MKKRAIILLTILVSSISIQQTLGQNNSRVSNDAFRMCLKAMQSTNDESMHLDYALSYFANEPTTTGQLPVKEHAESTSAPETLRLQ